MKNFRRKEFKDDTTLPEIGDRSLNDEELGMINGVISLDETTVKECMVPRIDALFLNCDLSYQESMELIIAGSYSRYPVYEKNIDNVVGVLYVKDLLRSLYHTEKFDIKKLLRPAFFVPESKKLDSLLREFLKKRVHIAVAVDEYGGVSGVLCLEDIIERIVGNIQDEFDDEGEELITLGDSLFLCDARMNIDELNNQLSLELPNQDFDTIGGFVFDLFGTVPSIHAKVLYQGIEFTVQEIEGHKIKRIKLIIPVKKEEVHDKDSI